MNIPEGQALARLSGDKDIFPEQTAKADNIETGNFFLAERPVVVGFGSAGILEKYGG